MKNFVHAVKITLEKVEIKETGDWLGKGEVYFLGKIGARKLGRSKIFKAKDNTVIPLSGTAWEYEERVKGKSSIDVVLDAWDEDLIWDDGLGRARFSVKPPWDRQSDKATSDNGNYTLYYSVGNTTITLKRTGVGLISREHDGSAYKSTLSSPLVAIATIIDVAGLYKPGKPEHNQKIDIDQKTTKLSAYHKGEPGKPGYKSEDDKGRIFINHIPLPDPRTADPVKDWQDTWKKNAQYIDLTVEVTPASVKLPADAKLVWEWEDPDDPSNEDPKVRKDAGMILDPNDYDHGAKTKLGAVANDNRGKRDHPAKDAATGAAFEKIDPYAMSPVGGKPKQCETEIKSRLSKVRLHCTNVGGDNFVVRVKIKKHDKIDASLDDATGMMTMWKRIDVEYRKMTGALDLPVKKVPGFFEMSFVQMDFGEPLPASKKAFLAKKNKDKSKKAAELAQAPPIGIFENAKKPGWFLLVAAHEASEEVGTATSTRLYNGAAKFESILMRYDARIGVVDWEVIVIPVKLKVTDKVSFIRLKDGAKRTTLMAWDFENDKPNPGECRIFISALDYQSDFVPGDGALGDPGLGGAYDRTDLYFPRHKLALPAKTWSGPGLGFGATVDVELFSPGSWATAGTSPEVKDGGGKEYFGGRTIIFTKHGAYRAGDATALSEIQDTIVHEFGHAFGFPHKCGYYSFENPAKYSCSMNYGNTWLYKLGTRDLDRFHTGDAGKHLCARHIDGIRRVHLEDNKAMWTT